jgi:hypothetical protein
MDLTPRNHARTRSSVPLVRGNVAVNTQLILGDLARSEVSNSIRSHTFDGITPTTNDHAGSRMNMRRSNTLNSA